MMSNRTARRAQIALGLLWLIDGALQCQPYMFGRSFVTGVLLPSATGQPAFIGAPIGAVAHLIEPDVALFNGFAAMLQLLIGAGLLHRPTVKPALAVSFVWAGAIWIGGEGLGMLFTGTASSLTGAPGAALLYVLAGLMCWPSDRAARGLPGSGIGLVAGSGARAAWAAIWLAGAVLWLLPSNLAPGAVHDAIAAAPAGAGWLSSLLGAAAATTAGQGTRIAITMAAVSAAIGVAVLRGWLPRAVVAMQVSLMVPYWILGQGLGGALTGRATDVGTAPLMMLIALIVPPPGRRISARQATASPSSTGRHLQHAGVRLSAGARFAPWGPARVRR